MASNKARNGRKPRGLGLTPARAAEYPVDEEADLHGMAVDEALVAAEALLKRHRAGATVRIIHGHSNRGNDSIRTNLHRALTSVWKNRVKRFRTDFHNPGATLIEIA
jgi:DNA-nicking Smr family endonuclease